MLTENAFKRLMTTLAIILIAIACYCLSSCSGNRHLTKSETESDSTVVIKTEVSKDSVVNTSTISKTEINEENDIQSKDDYEEVITEYYSDGSGNTPTVSKRVITRKGTETKKDNSKKKTNIDVKDTTHSAVKTSEKVNNKIEVKKEASDKKVDSEYGILSKGNVIVGILVLIIGVLLAWRWVKRKYFTT